MPKTLTTLVYPFDEYVFIGVNNATNRLSKKLQQLLGGRLTIKLIELEKLLEIQAEVDEEFDKSSIYFDESGLCIVIKSVNNPEQVLGILLPVYVFNTYKGNIKKALRYALDKTIRRQIMNKIDYGVGFFVNVN